MRLWGNIRANARPSPLRIQKVGHRLPSQCSLPDRRPSPHFPASRTDTVEIGGSLILLQLWAWERFPHIAPVVHRRPLWRGTPLGCRWRAEFDVTSEPTHVVRPYMDAFDLQTPEQVIWEPYTTEIMSSLPAYCLEGQDLYTARVPLIHFCIVELYVPDRVLRQFGSVQEIPVLCDTSTHLHSIDLRGKTSVDWVQYHANYVQMWNNRRDYVLATTPIGHGGHDVSADYMAWYNRITRQFIGRHGCVLDLVATRLDEIVHLVGPNEDVIRLVTDTRRLLDDSIQRQFRDGVHEDEEDEEGHTTDGTSSQQQGRGRRHGRVRRTRGGRTHPHVEDVQASEVEYQTPAVERETEGIQHTLPAPMRDRPHSEAGPSHRHSPLPPLDYDVMVDKEISQIEHIDRANLLSAFSVEPSTSLPQ